MKCPSVTKFEPRFFPPAFAKNTIDLLHQIFTILELNIVLSKFYSYLGYIYIRILLQAMGDTNKPSGEDDTANGSRKHILINAFDMSTVGHLSPGQWKVSIIS